MLYKTIRNFLSIFLTLFFRIEYIGRENEPKDGAIIVCSNHISLWDPVIVAVAIKRPVHFMAKKELFKFPILKWVLPKVGAFPVSRDTNDLGAVKNTISLLRQEKPVGIFLQGTRHRGVDPKTTTVKSGVGMMLARTGSNALPVFIHSKDNRIKIGKKVKVYIGKPVIIEKNEAGIKHSKDYYQNISDEIFKRMYSLPENS